MLGAWSAKKIPLLLFETSAMGFKLVFIRLLLDLVGITVIASFTEKLLSKRETEEICENELKL